MSFLEKLKGKPSSPEDNDRQKETRLKDFEKRLDDLNAWQNHWTPDDRVLADNLQSQIDNLKREFGK